MIIKAATLEATIVAELANKLWPGHSIEGLAEDFTELISRKDAAVFLLLEQENAVGFAQCQLRNDYVEGTESSPVGYLEGIFVDEQFRNHGYAKALLQACENWAKENGCSEFASDCELDNETSLRFHLETGFIEANRIICFTKKL